MKKEIRILYFSGTGNTKMVAERIGNCLLEKGYPVTLLSLEEAVSKERSWENCILGFGFPVYAIQYPEIFDALIEKLPVFSNAVPAFIFSTKGTYDGDSRALLAKNLRKKNVISFASATFKCPNNCFVNILGEKRFHNVFGIFDRNMEEKIRIFSEDIVKGLEEHFKGRKSKHVNPVFRIVSPVLKGIERQVFKSFTVDENACAGCGACERNCPAGRIRMEAGMVKYDPKPCMGCMRCVSDCPKGAISFGGFLNGRGIYTKKYRSACRKEANL